MRETNYMSSSALIEFLKVGILAGELDIIAANTKKTAKTPKEKRWAKDMRMSATLTRKYTHFLTMRESLFDEVAYDETRGLLAYC